MAKHLRALIIAALLPLICHISVKAEQFNLSDEIVALTRQYASEDVPSELIQAVIWTESRGQSDAVSADGLNVGLMQLHIWYFDGDLTDSDNNVKQGAAYLQTLFDKYGDISKALMAYHGEGDINKPPSYYARSITALAAQIKQSRYEASAQGAGTKEGWQKMLTKHEQNKVLLEEWKQKQAEMDFLHRQRLKAVNRSRRNYEDLERGYQNEITGNTTSD